MSTVPTTLTAVAGAVLTATEWNTNNRDVENWLLAPAILQIRQSVAQSIANSSGPGAALTYTSEDVDSTGMHSTSVNTSRATAVYPGWYTFGGSIGYAANATGQRGIIGNVNGAALTASGYGAYLDATASGICIVPFKNVLVFLNTGDYFEWFAVQTSGGALLTSVSANNQPTMTAVWVSN